MTQVIDFIGGEYRNRTGVHGFAIRCVTTPPTRQSGGLIRRLGGARQADIGWALRIRCGSISRVLRIAEFGQLCQKSNSELNG